MLMLHAGSGGSVNPWFYPWSLLRRLCDLKIKMMLLKTRSEGEFFGVETLAVLVLPSLFDIAKNCQFKLQKTKSSNLPSSHPKH